MEKIFTVKPEAEPERIRVKLEGVEFLRVNESGELVASSELGEIVFTKPLAYQEIGGKRRPVKVAYVLYDNVTYGFKVSEDYDRTRPLVIDPLLAFTYFGGSSKDIAFALSLDSSGNVYVAGSTISTDFPTTSGAYQTTHGGFQDVFVSKLDPDLSGAGAGTVPSPGGTTPEDGGTVSSPEGTTSPSGGDGGGCNTGVGFSPAILILLAFIFIRRLYR